MHGNIIDNQLSETSLGLVAAAVAQCASEASDDGVEVITVHAHSHTGRSLQHIIPRHLMGEQCSLGDQRSHSGAASIARATTRRYHHCCTNLRRLLSRQDKFSSCSKGDFLLEKLESSPGKLMPTAGGGAFAGGAAAGRVGTALVGTVKGLGR